MLKYYVFQPNLTTYPCVIVQFKLKLDFAKVSKLD